MSYFRHHTIVVSTFLDEKEIEVAHKKASEIFPIVSEILGSNNGFRSFFIPPDGGKEEFWTSMEGDARRDEFIQWLRSYHPDTIRQMGSNEIDWVEVQFADNDWDTKIVRSSDHDSQAWGRRRDEADEFERRYFPDPSLSWVASRLRTILARYTPSDLSGLGPDDALAEDLGLQEGFNVSTFILDISDEFGMVIPVAEAERMTTLRDYVTYVMQVRKANQSAGKNPNATRTSQGEMSGKSD